MREVLGAGHGTGSIRVLGGLRRQAVLPQDAKLHSIAATTHVAAAAAFSPEHFSSTSHRLLPHGGRAGWEPLCHYGRNDRCGMRE
jgi:hypothetical protein